MADLDSIGGLPVVMKELLAVGLIHGDCLTVTGRTVAENLQDVPKLSDVPQQVTSCLPSLQLPATIHAHLTAPLGGGVPPVQPLCSCWLPYEHTQGEASVSTLIKQSTPTPHRGPWLLKVLC